MRAPSRIVITGSSIRRHAAWAGGIATPSRARRSAGSTRPAPRQAAVRAPELAEPGRHAGHRARRRADGVVHELGAERHLRGRAAPARVAWRRFPAMRRSSRGCARSRSRRRDRSRGRRRAGRSSPSRRRTTRGPLRRRHRRPEPPSARISTPAAAVAGCPAATPAFRTPAPSSPAASRASRCARCRRAGSRAGGSSARRPRSRRRRRRSAARAGAARRAARP